MRATDVLRALGPIDALSVGRDSFLRWMFAMPLLLALLLRWGLPPLGRLLDQRFGIAIEPYHPLIGSFVVLTTPMLYGTVIGFLLLDQKDDRTLAALQVTPLTLRGYASYRIGLPMALSMVMTVIAIRLTGLVAPGLAGQLRAAVAAAPLAPAFALFLAGFAANKVQGFALMKASGAINWPPIIAWFAPDDVRWVFGLCPTYWPAKVYWDLSAGEPGLWPLLLGTAYVGAIVAFLMHRFDRAMHG